MSKDMYGHEIIPIDRVYGVSVTRDREGLPYFTFFRLDDGFRQALFGVAYRRGRPAISNVFDERFAEAEQKDRLEAQEVVA